VYNSPAELQCSFFIFYEDQINSQKDVREVQNGEAKSPPVGYLR